MSKAVIFTWIFQSTWKVDSLYNSRMERVGLMVLLQRDRLNCYVHLFELACLGTPNNYPLYTLIASPRKNICFCCSSTPLLVSCAKKKRNRTFRKLLFHDDQNVNVMTRLIYMSYCLKGYAKNNSSLL